MPCLRPALSKIAQEYLHTNSCINVFVLLQNMSRQYHTDFDELVRELLISK